jgi:hypothetical protein
MIEEERAELIRELRRMSKKFGIMRIQLDEHFDPPRNFYALGRSQFNHQENADQKRRDMTNELPSAHTTEFRVVRMGVDQVYTWADTGEILLDECAEAAKA